MQRSQSGCQLQEGQSKILPVQSSQLAQVHQWIGGLSDQGPMMIT